jgi:ABC-type xylose transport system substrate-binding protein
MATVSKTLFRGAATTTTTTTLYTVPSATTTVVTNIVVANTSSLDQTFTFSLAGVRLAETVTIAGRDSTVLDIKQVINATQTIQGGASATSVTFHIGGVEIS